MGKLPQERIRTDWRICALNDTELFLKNNAVFHDNNAPIHKAGIVQSWFKDTNINFSVFPGQHKHNV
jgi:hypothetical protein